MAHSVFNTNLFATAKEAIQAAIYDFVEIGFTSGNIKSHIFCTGICVSTISNQLAEWGSGGYLSKTGEKRRDFSLGSNNKVKMRGRLSPVYRVEEKDFRKWPKSVNQSTAFAKRTGIPVEVTHFYEKKGGVFISGENEGNQRRSINFTSEDPVFWEDLAVTALARSKVLRAGGSLKQPVEDQPEQIQNVLHPEFFLTSEKRQQQLISLL